MHTQDDSTIIARVRSGDRQAYGGLVERHQGKVYGLTLSLLQNPADAEDAAQETFIKAFRSLERFEGGSAFSTWLFRIASNHCLDLLRAKRRRKAESLDELVERHGDKLHALLEAAPASERGPEDLLLIDQVLSTLPPEYRTILTLRETQGLSYEEISKSMDCSLDSVKARLRRARGLLQEKLRPASRDTFGEVGASKE